MRSSLISRSAYVLFGKMAIYLVMLFFLTGCNIFNSDDTPINYEYNFRESQNNWEPFFTNYFVGREDKMELTSDHKTLPEPLDTGEKGLFISGNNISDDLKMLFRKKVDGLEPNETYRVYTIIRFATEEPSGCLGIGGAPGEAVKIISAASTQKPAPFVGGNNDDYYLLNIQHKDNSQRWYQNHIMGNITNSRECEEGDQFELEELKSDSAQDIVKTNENGEAWLLFGTRSGFEGKTKLYYTYFKAEFRN